MGRPGLTRHRKFLRLSEMVGDVLTARGLLETLWDSAYESGDDLIGDAVDVELMSGWRSTRRNDTDVCAALVRCGFIDQREDGLYYVHDLWDHAPDYVRKRRSREQERRTKGAALSSMSDRDRSVTGQCPPNGRTRAPAPAPAPAPSERDKTETTTEDVHASVPPDPGTRFVKPTLEELTTHCRERGYTFSPEAFLAHYESNGWRVGRTAMRSWRAACVTWQNNERPGNGGRPERAAAVRAGSTDATRAQVLALQERLKRDGVVDNSGGGR